MTRTPRWAAALTLALALSACGGGGDDPTLASGGDSAAATPPASAPAAAPASCPTTVTPVPAPQGVGSDLTKAPVVPPNSAAPVTGVQVADVVAGNGTEAKAGDKVEVKYVGALDTTGKVFDSSWSRGPQETIPFTVCGSDVVPGFSVSPLGMKVGGRRLVRIPDAQGYPGGNPQAGIPAGAVITFVIDLVKVG